MTPWVTQFYYAVDALSSFLMSFSPNLTSNVTRLRPDIVIAIPSVACLSVARNVGARYSESLTFPQYACTTL